MCDLQARRPDFEGIGEKLGRKARVVGGVKNHEKLERTQDSISVGFGQETLVARNCQFCLELELQYGRCCEDCCARPLGTVG